MSVHLLANTITNVRAIIGQHRYKCPCLSWSTPLQMSTHILTATMTNAHAFIGQHHYKCPCLYWPTPLQMSMSLLAKTITNVHAFIDQNHYKWPCLIDRTLQTYLCILNSKLRCRWIYFPVLRNCMWLCWLEAERRLNNVTGNSIIVAIIGVSI